MSANHRVTTVSRLLAASLAYVVSAQFPVSAQESPQREPVVELRAGTLNGRPVTEWTMEELTDAFGRPSAVASGVAGITGAQLHYHSRGMSFWLSPKEKDPAQHLWMLTIYLSRDWDESNSAWFDAFRGQLTPAVDANWKQSRILSEFESLNPVVKTVEERRRELDAAGITRLGVRAPQTDFIYVNVGSLRVTFTVEPNTKFVERIVVGGGETKR